MLSVSSLTSYLYCKRKLYLNKVLGFIEPPKEITVIGSLRHNIYDRVNKIEKEIILAIKNKDLDSVLSLYKTKYIKEVRDAIINFMPKLKQVSLELDKTFETIWPFLEKEYTFRAINVYEFMMEHDYLGQELWEKLTPKIESEVRIESKEMDLVGVIDRVEIYKGNIIPAELKTGKAPRGSVWSNHKIQLAAYMLLLEEKYAMEIKGGYVHYLNEDLKFDVIMNPFLKDEIQILIQKVKELLDSSQIPGRVNSKIKCDACSLRSECYDEKLLKEKYMIGDENYSNRCI